ncbi:MAG: hypothetical protein Q7R41_01085 [Phycisphaerales bacterium]|nr:hypothetical protein [Phycisphaerales bacterium]
MISHDQSCALCMELVNMSFCQMVIENNGTPDVVVKWTNRLNGQRRQRRPVA